MDSNEQEYIRSVAAIHGVAPYQLMDLLKIRYSNNKYHVNDKVFLSYCDAVREADLSFAIVQGHSALSQADIDKAARWNKRGFRVIGNIHFSMSVIYFHLTIALFIFLSSIRPDAIPMKLALIEIAASMLLVLHVLALFSWMDNGKFAKTLSVIAGVTLLPGFPIGSILGISLLYCAGKVTSIRTLNQ